MIAFEDDKVLFSVNGMNDFYGLSKHWDKLENKLGYDVWSKVVDLEFKYPNGSTQGGLAVFHTDCYNSYKRKVNLKNNYSHQRGIRYI